jgi:hypothetical protein
MFKLLLTFCEILFRPKEGEGSMNEIKPAVVNTDIRVLHTKYHPFLGPWLSVAGVYKQFNFLRGEGITHLNNPRSERPMYLSFNGISPKT